METEVEKILLDNFKETLKQFQNYIVWALVATLSYYLLTLSKSNTTQLNLPVIGSINAIDKSLASVISISVFWFLGAMASYALERADRIAVTLKAYGKEKLLKAMVTYPSIATEPYPLIRLAPALISILLIIAARVEVWSSASKTDRQLSVLFLLLVPYITIAVKLIKNSLPVEKPQKLKIKN
jgi:hypothetical protein